jgi:alpha-L-arabinofuranosidase
VRFDAVPRRGEALDRKLRTKPDGGRPAAIVRRLVNPGDTAAPVQLNVAGATLRPTATALTIAGSAQDTNSIDAPERVVPKKSQVTAVTSGFTYTVPANGIVVLTLGMQ